MPDLDALEVLTLVARHGSVAAASHALGIPRSTATRRLQHLEACVGVPLLHSHSTGASLTPAGQTLAEGAVPLLESAKRLEADAREAADRPHLFRVGMPAGLGWAAFSSLLEQSREHLEHLSFEVRYSAQPLHPIRDHLDLVLTFEAATDETLLSPRLVDITWRAFAHSRYVMERGHPAGIEDLPKHRTAAAELWGAPSPHQWPLLQGGTAPLEPAFIANSLGPVWGFVESAQGIGLLPDPGASSPLEPVLPQIVGLRTPLYLVMARRLGATKSGRRVRAVLEILREGLLRQRT